MTSKISDMPSEDYEQTTDGLMQTPEQEDSGECWALSRMQLYSK